jgi:hypothetical protein
MTIFEPHDGQIFGHQTTREFMVAVCALIGEPFVQPCRQPRALPALCLG